MASATTAAPVYDRLTSPHECEAPETPTSPQQEHNVSMLKLLITAMPRMAIVMCWSAQWAVIGPYLATMLPNYAIQLTQVAGPLTGLFFNPIIGILSDRSTNKYGRRRPILIGGALSSVLCCMVASYAREISAFIGHNETSTRHWTAALMVLCYIWMDVTINVISTPAYLLVADVAGDRQLTGAAMAEGWATFGSILVSGYIQVFGPAYLSLHYFLAMLAIGMILSVGLVCLFVNEVPPSQSCASEPMHRRVLEAFGIVQSSLRSLPRVLVTYCFIFFCVQYGFAAYSGNKGQFFGLVVFGGSAENADKCGDACTKEQLAYSHGVQLAGGFTDLLFNVVAYTYSWIIPLLVKAFGAKRVLTCSLIPQACLIAVAFCQIVAVDVVVVVAMSLSQSGMFALLVPVIVHVVGHQAQIGIYVGALNSASSLGQLLNFALGAALVETSMGYRLPVFIGGLVSAIAVVASIFVLKLKMHSL